MSKLRLAAAFGLTLVMLAACERSSAVATRTDGTDRRDHYEDNRTSDRPGDSAEDRPSSYQAQAARDEPARQINGKAIWSSSRKGTAEENAERSFVRNGEDFGARDLDAYIRKAQAFVSKPPAGAQTLKRANGDILIYDASSNVFAVATRDGVPRAMFKPDQGAAYWDIQKARETKRQTAKADRRASDTEG